MSKLCTLQEISDQDIGLSFIMDQKLSITPGWRFGSWKDEVEKVVKAAGKKREELVKELGVEKADKSFEVLPKNKEKYLESYKKLMAEKKAIEIPEIQTSLLKDVPVSVRFTTLIGHYLINDTSKIKHEKVSATNQQFIDADLGLAAIMAEMLPIGLALKLGDAKRCTETVAKELQEKRTELIKKYGVLNDDFNYEVKDQTKQKLIDDELTNWKEQKREKVEMPVIILTDFETTYLMDGKKQEIKLPFRFFTLMKAFIKDKDSPLKKSEKEV